MEKSLALSVIFMDGKNRRDIHPGLEVDIVLKEDQRTGKRTRGIVKELLTSSSFHPHGIKVRLQSGQVGRVQEIISK
jgi:uncharacterized repeat protein (TIGR03833 family)